MDEMFGMTLWGANKLSAAEELRDCNVYTVRYGLTLTDQQIQTLVDKRFEALTRTGRVEFGLGITKMLIEAFCDSPYIDQANYEETMMELLDSFYYFKNESEDRIPDDELIAFMRLQFDTTCQGSVEFLNGTLLEGLSRNARYGFNEEADDLDAEEDLKSDEEATQL